MIRIVMIFLFAVSAYSETSVWKVTHADKTLYLGGTLPIVRADEYPFPHSFKKAFDASDVVVFETDVGALNATNKYYEIKRRMSYDANQSLQNSINKATYARLQAYADRHQLSMQMFDRIKPPLILMMLMATHQQEQKMTEPGVDLYFYDQAFARGKEIRWFESIKTQLKLVQKIGENNQSRLLNNVLTEIEHYDTYIPRMIKAWQEGNVTAIEKNGMTYFLHDRESDYYNFVVDRNHRWIQCIDAMIQSDKIEFVLLGVMHMVGEDGIVAQLRKLGYTVEQL